MLSFLFELLVSNIVVACTFEHLQHEHDSCALRTNRRARLTVASRMDLNNPEYYRQWQLIRDAVKAAIDSGTTVDTDKLLTVTTYWKKEKSALNSVVHRLKKRILKAREMAARMCATRITTSATQTNVPLEPATTTETNRCRLKLLNQKKNSRFVKMSRAYPVIKAAGDKSAKKCSYCWRSETQ